MSMFSRHVYRVTEFAEPSVVPLEAGATVNNEVRLPVVDEDGLRVAGWKTFRRGHERLTVELEEGYDDT